MIKLFLVVTTMFVSGYDVKTTEVTDMQRCVADAPTVLQGVELVRGVRGAKVECIERKTAEGGSSFQDDVKVSLTSTSWVEPASRPSTSRFEDYRGSYGNPYGSYAPRDYDDYYDAWGYDRWGYDRWGYDRWGYDRWGYDRSGYPRYGYRYNYGQVPSWANPPYDFCGTYPGHPSCRPDWSRAPSYPIPDPSRAVPNPAHAVPNPSRPVNQ